MNPLASRKKLLVAESELNRAQLVQAWHTMTDEGRALANQARTIRSLVSAAASLMTGLASLGRKKNRACWRKTAVVADRPERRGIGRLLLV